MPAEGAHMKKGTGAPLDNMTIPPAIPIQGDGTACLGRNSTAVTIPTHNDVAWGGASSV
jgi:hypothetical protein